MMECRFHIGQKVVCVDTGHNVRGRIPVTTHLKKGKIYTVIGIEKSCCGFIIDVGLKAHTGCNTCMICGKDYFTYNGARWFKDVRFAPLTHTDCTAEIAASLTNVEEKADQFNQPVMS
jgi:hypothetical protein